MAGQPGNRRYRVRAQNASTLRPFLNVGGNDETQSFFRQRKPKKKANQALDRIRNPHILQEVCGPRDIQREALRQQRPLRSLHSVIESTTDAR